MMITHRACNIRTSRLLCDSSKVDLCDGFVVIHPHDESGMICTDDFLTFYKGGFEDTPTPFINLGPTHQSLKRMRPQGHDNIRAYDFDITLKLNTTA